MLARVYALVRATNVERPKYSKQCNTVKPMPVLFLMSQSAILK